MRRHLLGIIGILLVVIGGVFYLLAKEPGIAAAGLRVGIMLIALWMSWPQLARMNVWLYAAIVGGVVAIAKYPSLIWFVAPAILLFWFFQPRAPAGKKTPPTALREPAKPSSSAPKS